jgi:hypothetical protein
MSSIEDTADGLFAVNTKTKLGASFVGAAMAARNFGYANRQLVAAKVVEILRRRFADQVVSDAEQLRHVDHVAFESLGEGIRSRRGLQPLSPHRPVFITGGEHTHAYLCTTGGNGALVDNLCCHGSPVREAAGLPTSIWTDPLFGTDPSQVRRWSAEMMSNTDIQDTRFWSDVLNLESVVSYLRTSDTAQPLARLRPFMNYRETAL